MNTNARERKFLHSRALVLERDPPREAHETLYLLTPAHGLLRAYRRVSKKASGTGRPDLFDTLETVLEEGRGGGLFLREYTLEHRRSGIGGSYRRLEQACAFARFLRVNLAHAEHFTEGFALAETAFDAWEQGQPPEAVRFKAIYRLLQSEGYPVKEEWLAGLSAPAQARTVLRTPLANLTPDDAHAAGELRHALETWMRQNTEWIVPDEQAD